MECVIINEGGTNGIADEMVDLWSSLRVGGLCIGGFPVSSCYH
jgi:hypothetical protein